MPAIPSIGFSMAAMSPAALSASSRRWRTARPTFISSPTTATNTRSSLREVSGDADPHFDSKVFIVPGDKAAKDRLIEMPVFVPAAELDQVKQEAAAAQAAEAAAQKAEADKRGSSTAASIPAPCTLTTPGTRRRAKSSGLEQIWRDDKFTYLRGQFQETPALYEVKDKKPSLINFDFSNGLYTVPKELDNGYLAIGKQKVEFHRTEEAR